MGMLANVFTWWNGATIGTSIFTRRHGREIGRDGQGNVYYTAPGTGLPGSAAERRFVIYNGATDSSRVPPEWHLWLHHSTARPPSEMPLAAQLSEKHPWEKPWRANPTGSVAAELPAGALAGTGVRARSVADYESWSPE
jgi:NADH:ubiquinone oxidoreductase subunit